jgi:hypothetical protein
MIRLRNEETAWSKAMVGLVHVVGALKLPIPMALTWDEYRQEVQVQVSEPHYRAWMEAIETPVMESQPHEGATHLFASGRLRNCTMVQVRVVAVCHKVGELPEVGVR